MDRISTFRTARLLIHVPQSSSPLAPWALHAVATRRGVPDARVLQGGYVPAPRGLDTEEDIWEALDRVVSQFLLS